MVADSNFPREPILPSSTTTILVTGANGFVASHIVLEALKLGYKVRGTSRNAEKAQAAHKLYDHHPKYSSAVVSDFADAMSEIERAVQGVDSIIHVASDTTFSPDPNKVITPVVDGTLNVLRAAAKEPSVRRFTLTSSSTAVVAQSAGGTPESILTADSWNEESVKKAWTKPGPEGWPENQGSQVYYASKVQSERTFWKFVKEEQPTFAANAVLPNLNFGRVLPGGSPGGSGGAVPLLYTSLVFPPIAPMHYINVTDTARLHLAAAVLDGSLEGQRIYAFADQFNWNDVLEIIVKLRPEKAMPLSKDEKLGRDLTKPPKKQGIELLRKWFGQEGYTSLEESVRQNLEGVE